MTEQEQRQIEAARNYVDAWLQHLYNPSHREPSTVIVEILARIALTQAFYSEFVIHPPDVIGSRKPFKGYKIPRRAEALELLQRLGIKRLASDPFQSPANHGEQPKGTQGEEKSSDPVDPSPTPGGDRGAGEKGGGE